MRFLRASLMLSVLLVAGCREEDTIKKYEVEHIDREWLMLRVAVFEHKDAVWFFRISGPEVLIKEQVPTFDAMVESVKFDDKNDPPISFDDPKGWKKDGKLMFRFASYTKEVQGKLLEIKITKLKREDFEWLPNIHRWQKELNLPLAEANEIDAIKEPGKIGDHEVTWIKKLRAMGVYQVGAREPEPPPRKKGPPPGADDGATPFKMEIPKGWEKKRPTDGITAALYVIAEKGKEAKVTFTQAGGGLGKNINRWRTEKLGLPAVSEQEAVRSAAVIDVAGAKAHYVDLENPRGDPEMNRILAVIVPIGPSQWFIRLSGPADLVGQNKNAFETFVKSLKIDK